MNRRRILNILVALGVLGAGAAITASVYAALVCGAGC